MLPAGEQMTRIGVTFDEGSEDHRTLAERALRELGTVIPLAADPSLPTRLREERPDIVVNVARGSEPPSRRLHVASFLEYFGIPFLGSDALTQATCLQRARMKESLSYHGVATPAFELIERHDQLFPFARRAYPVAVSRARTIYGCAATHMARDFTELRDIATELLEAAPGEPILVERLLPGDAFACAVLGNGADLVILPIIAVDREGGYWGSDGEVRRDARRDGRATAARLSDGLREAIESIAMRAWRALGCRDLARIDVQLTEAGLPNVCALDPLPSLTADGGDETLLAASRAAGLDDHVLLQRCLLIAAKRANVSIPRAPRFERLPRRTPPGGIRALLLN